MTAGRPSSITKNKSGSTTILTRKLFHPIAFFLLLFTISWDAFLINWYFGVGSGDMPLIFYIFPLIHVAAGVAMTYLTICIFINKTEILVTNGKLSVKDSPLPFGNTKNLHQEKFQRIQIQEKGYSNRNSSSQYYHLLGLTTKGDLKKIISFLKEKEEALYIKQELETLLHINPE